MTWSEYFQWFKQQTLNDAYLNAKSELLSEDFKLWLASREPKIKKEILAQAPPDIARRLSA